MGIRSNLDLFGLHGSLGNPAVEGHFPSSQAKEPEFFLPYKQKKKRKKKIRIALALHKIAQLNQLVASLKA